MNVISPTYSRDDLTVGIVHFGVGNFHRSHQAMYLDRLFRADVARDWAVCGVGLLPGDARMRDALESHGMTYTLVERFPDGTNVARTIASVAEYLFAPDNPEAVMERLADPDVRIVSLTLTEGGYNIDDGTGVFLLTESSVAADLLLDGAGPVTAFGLVTEGLRRRRDRGLLPFTVVSCDNLPGNGRVAAQSFVSFARAKDAELGQWIADNVAFPNSMVDRITPVTGAEERRFVSETFGLDETWPVVAEGFEQWVLEDHFTAGRPPLEQAGVQLVDDVAPYEMMKLRLLNASHQAMAYFGYLAGFRFAHDAAADPLIQLLIRRYMHEEAEPTLDEVPGINLADYQEGLIERFTNPYVSDTLLRLATDGADRIAKFVLPVARDRLAAGQSIKLTAAIAASWAVFARGLDESGNRFDVPDRQSELVQDAVALAADDPSVLVADQRLFGDLSETPAFAGAFSWAYRKIREKGARDALVDMVGDPVVHS